MVTYPDVNFIQQGLILLNKQDQVSPISANHTCMVELDVNQLVWYQFFMFHFPTDTTRQFFWEHKTFHWFEMVKAHYNYSKKVSDMSKCISQLQISYSSHDMTLLCPYTEDSSFALLHQSTPKMTARERGERNKDIAVMKTTKKANLTSYHQHFSSPKLEVTQHCTSWN